jgi:hypothetical protein
MRTRLTVRPGHPGARKLTEIYGERLVCVRYRYDAVRRCRVKTVELIVEEAPWEPPAPPPHASPAEPPTGDLTKAPRAAPNENDENKARRGIGASAIVAVALSWDRYLDLRKRLYDARARWNPHERTWEMEYRHACTLGLADLVRGPAGLSPQTVPPPHPTPPHPTPPPATPPAPQPTSPPSRATSTTPSTPMKPKPSSSAPLPPTALARPTHRNSISEHRPRYA